MTAKAKAKQSDIERVGRAARKLGAKAVRVRQDGSIDIVLEGAQMLPTEQPDDPAGWEERLRAATGWRG